MAPQRSKDILSVTDESGVIDARAHVRTASGFAPKVTTITGPPTAPLFEGRYRIVRDLGAGAMGVVYLAHDVNLDRLVALKVIAPAHAESPEAVARLRREARGLAALRAPNVVGVHAFGEHEGTYFFAMEYVEGTDLETILDAERRALAIPRVVRVLREVASGLAAVHGAGLVHRDVKPANILIEEGTARTVLVDFGLADDALGAEGAGGSPAYCSRRTTPRCSLVARVRCLRVRRPRLRAHDGKSPFRRRRSRVARRAPRDDDASSRLDARTRLRATRRSRRTRPRERSLAPIPERSRTRT